MDALRPIELPSNGPEAVSEVAAALADAFRFDPVLRWILRGRLRVGPRLRAMFMAEMQQYALPRGSVWTTPGYDGAVIALPPGEWAMPISVTLGQALQWVRAFGIRLPLAGEVQKALEERHLREPHFYIRTVGVRRALQGRGVGSLLMQPTLERADAVSVPTYLEASSARSATLYERLGFVHLGVLELPRGGPPIWPMRRPPAEPAANPGR